MSKTKQTKEYWTTQEIAIMRGCSLSRVNQIIADCPEARQYMMVLGTRKYFTRQGVDIILSSSHRRGRKAPHEYR